MSRTKHRKHYRIKKLNCILALALCILIPLTAMMACQKLGEEPDAQLAGGDIQTSSASEPEAEPEPEPVTTSVDLIAVGDNLIHEPVYYAAEQEDGTYNFDGHFTHVAEDIAQADIAVINQETILGGTELGLSGYPMFNSPQEMGDALVKVGFDVILQATNHSVDKGYTGAKNAIDFWKENYPDIVTLGLNDSAEEQQEVDIIEINDIRIAMLNYTYGLNGLSMPSEHPYLVNLLDDRELMETHIKKAKEEADIVIVYPHWGTEYVYTADSYQKDLTDFFAEQGVDIVIGTHPHVLQPVEWVAREDGGQMLVYYSLGNFLSNQSAAPRMLGGMARITIEKTGDEVTITNAKLTPLVTHFERSGAYHYGVYKLADYTDELAKVHGVLSWDSSFSIARLEGLLENIIDEEFLDY